MRHRELFADIYIAAEHRKRRRNEGVVLTISPAASPTILKSLEDENAKLKRLLADAMLDNVALKDLLQKKF